MQVELWPESGLLKPFLTLSTGYHRHLHLLQHLTELSRRSEGVLAPACGVAAVVELCALLRQADRRDVWAAWAGRKSVVINIQSLFNKEKIIYSIKTV